ncbi:unnamed protein product [Leptidea sinapis]|uniref:Uncharacterized protein n=1 Tax=Leptidea sinapis TaxID=189913 RepID=A0A5E4Q917_9NEOP|nr:unnamed protein product [Leptidea sinapis]
MINHTFFDELVEGRPLCLFYFTHPFGVLSPEPPTVTAAPPNISRTYVNMEPVPSFWSSSPDYESSSSRPSYDIGNASVHQTPVNLIRNISLDFARDSLSSSLFSSEFLFSNGTSARERRVIPYNKILPPLELPSPKDLSVSEKPDAWSRNVPERFSLPPIEMTCSVSESVDLNSDDAVNRRCRRFVAKKKGPRLSSLRRTIACLMRRNIKVFDTQTKMGYILDDCPQVNNFCFCIPLRAGVKIIAVICMIISATFIYGFTPPGIELAKEWGLPESVAKSVRYYNGFIGVLLFAVSLLLLFAAIYDSDSLCEVFIWFKTCAAVSTIKIKKRDTMTSCTIY